MWEPDPVQIFTFPDEPLSATYARARIMLAMLRLKMKIGDAELSEGFKSLQDKNARLIRKNKEQLRKVAYLNRKLQDTAWAWTDESLSTNNFRLHNEVSHLTRETKELLKKMGQFTMEKKLTAHHSRKNMQHMMQVAQLTRKLQAVEQSSARTDESLSANEVTQVIKEMKELLKKMDRFTRDKGKMLNALALYKNLIKQRTLLRKLMKSTDNECAMMLRAVTRCRCGRSTRQTENGKENQEIVVLDTDTD